MEAVIIAWVASGLVCSIFTFILPAWDAYQAANASRRSPYHSPQRSGVSSSARTTG